MNNQKDKVPLSEEGEYPLCYAKKCMIIEIMGSSKTRFCTLLNALITINIQSLLKGNIGKKFCSITECIFSLPSIGEFFSVIKSLDDHQQILPTGQSRRVFKLVTSAEIASNVYLQILFFSTPKFPKRLL